MNGHSVFETERLCFRPWRAADAAAAFAWTGDEEATRYMGWRRHGSVQETLSWVRSAIARNKRFVCEFAVVLKSTGALIGSCGGHKDKSPDSRRWCVGWILHPDYQNRGYGGELAPALVHYFFIEGRADEVYAQHQPANPKSGRLMQKAGLLYRGDVPAQTGNFGVIPCREYALAATDFFESAEGGETRLGTAAGGDGIELISTAADDDYGAHSVDYDVRECGRRVGHVRVTAGMTESYYYLGNLGYTVEEAFRGRGLGLAAAQAGLALARRAGMNRIIVTCNPDNLPTRRNIEALGGVSVRTVRVPVWHELYKNKAERVKTVYVVQTGE